MLNEHRWSLKSLARGLALAVAIGVAGTASVSMAAPEKKDAAKKDEVKTDQVELIFRSGKTVKGTLISETDTTIRLKVNVAGITGESTYEKADLLSITRNLPVPTDAGKKDPEPKKDTVAAADTAAPTDSGGKPKVYIINLAGTFYRDVNITPLKSVMEDVKREQPDYLVLKFDHTLRPEEDGELREYGLTQDGIFQQEIAEQMGLLFYDNIYLNDKWGKKPKLVGWIHRAIGGSAYLPFVCPQVYFTSDGLHGGLGVLDLMFGYADAVVREKWRGAIMGGASGMAIRGGYDPILIRAMLRRDTVLSYRIDGGKVTFLERMPTGPNEFLLTDDGRGENADAMQDIIRMRGNDALMLNADTALRIGFSRGTADSIDDLVNRLGITGEYVQLGKNADKILKDWSEAVSKAEMDIRRLFREYERAQQVRAPGGYKERSEARGRMIGVLRQIKTIIDRYKESIDPEAINGAPENFLTQIDQTIEGIQEQQRRDQK